MGGKVGGHVCLKTALGKIADEVLKFEKAYRETKYITNFVAYF